MKKVLQKIKLMFFILFLTICGCEFAMDMEQNWQYAISNNTNDTIIFCFSEKFNVFMKDTIVICNPYSESIFMDELLDYIKNHSCYPIPNLENKMELTVAVTTSSGRKLKKDIKKNSNWYCAENSRTLWKVVFEINEEDLE